MSGDSVWVRLSSTFGLGGAEKAVRRASQVLRPSGRSLLLRVCSPTIHNTLGGPLTDWDAFLGFLPGSVGEVSTLAILIGACILIYTGIASYKIMVSGVVGVVVMAAVFNAFGTTPAMQVSALHHLIYGASPSVSSSWLRTP